jgi:hypothetical protein
VSNNLPSYGLRMCRVWLKSVGCRDRAATRQIADECTTAAVPDGHSRCNYSHVVDKCQYLFSAGAEILRMAARRHEESRKRQFEQEETKGTESGRSQTLFSLFASVPMDCALVAGMAAAFSASGVRVRCCGCCSAEELVGLGPGVASWLARLAATYPGLRCGTALRLGVVRLGLRSGSV